MTANEDGTWNSEIRYTAFGEVRWKDGVTPTDYRYTGQLEQAEVGLYYYVARFYDPEIAHFVQADTVVPEPGNAAAWDRFAYVRNNPIRYNDPLGRDVGCSAADPKCKKQNTYTSPFTQTSAISSSNFEITSDGIKFSISAFTGCVGSCKSPMEFQGYTSFSFPP